MKEFSSQTGGRYTYVDDFLNLQELSLAYSAIFDNCDNFIVSGCEVSGTTISSGIVYLNGKLRLFSGATGITVWPQYIFEHNTTESTPYFSGDEKVGRNVWGCSIGQSVPSLPDNLTGKAPQCIKVTEEGGLLMKDAWFGKYALLLNPASKSIQTIKGDVGVTKLSGVELTASSKVGVASPSGKGSLYYDGLNMVLESAIDGETTKYRFIASHADEAFYFYRGSVMLAKISDGEITFASSVFMPKVKIGSLQIKDNEIINCTTATDDGAININMTSLNESSYYRNTYIGNGRGAAVVSVIGKTSTVKVDGQFLINSVLDNGIIFSCNKGKSDTSLKKYIEWQDNNSESMAVLGYTEAGTQLFKISNSIGAISIIAEDAVNIGPKIKEGGKLLSEKYVLKSDYDTAIGTKPNSENVYDKSTADEKFGLLKKGLKQFLGEGQTTTDLCREIGAYCKDDLSPEVTVYWPSPLKEKFLSDMVESEEDAAKIRKNIGAASKDDIIKTSDTGWVKITDTLYARMIGSIVSIQGTLVPAHSGVVFTLPNNIDPPRYTVGFSSWVRNTYNLFWRCEIEGGKKECKVTYCNDHNASIPFNLTYMT